MPWRWVAANLRYFWGIDLLASTVRLAANALAPQAQACYVKANDHPWTVEKMIIGRNVRLPDSDPVPADSDQLWIDLWHEAQIVMRLSSISCPCWLLN
jgi:hypothetical protein